MSTRRPRLSRRTASRMLDDPAAYASDRGLGELLSSARTSPTGLDADGEERAVAAFRAVAHHDSVPTIGGTAVMIRFSRKVVAGPAAALAAAGIVVAGGGIALAASQGAVHVPFTGHDNRPSTAPSAPASTNPGLSAPTTESTEDPATDEPTAPSPSATPSPSLDGLCVAYEAGAMAKAASNPAFTALQTAAGGADQVDAYCVSRIGAASHPTHPAQPTHPARPTHAATPHHRVAPTHPVKPTEAPEVSSPTSH